MRMSSNTMIQPLMLTLVLMLGGCSQQASYAVPDAPPREMPASVASVQLLDIAVHAPMAGTVVPLDEVQLTSRMMGYIRELKVVEGQVVKRGEVLFEIDPVDVQGAVAQARQGVVQAEAALKDAQADFKRFEQLFKEDVVNRQQFEKMRLNYAMAKSRLAQARAGLTQAQGQFEYTRVSSPIDGVVTAKFVNEGDMAAPGHPVLTVQDISRLQVQTSVPEQIFRHLKLGMTVEVEVEGHDKPVAATVARLSPSADPIARTYLVKLDIQVPGLRAGTFARVLFASGTQQVVAVPEKAVVKRAGIKGVFVVDARDIARFRMVRTGSRADGLVEVLSGLNVGERVVTEGVVQIQNGDKIIARSIAE